MAELVKKESTSDQLQQMVFGNADFGEVRTVVIDGEPWFVGKDVAQCLGYTNPSKALADHVDDDDKLNNKTLSSLGQRGGWLINESGMYALIFGSKLEKAREFKRWVTSEVLPTLRKTGHYEVAADQSVNQLLAEFGDFKVTYVQQMVEFKDALEKQTKAFDKSISNMTLSTSQQNKVHRAVKDRVGSLLGGAHSDLYKEKSRMYFANLWNDLKAEFECGSRWQDLNPAYMEEAMNWIRYWNYEGR
ncbi:BRO family protein [Anaerostipes hadrus]|uniref:BRO family protein n=1 Tax=Anaerostipes hadrus TaxID=649756 RepID=UPI00189B3605|nr:BRO family protein [Anaerostipes hadrus]